MNPQTEEYTVRVDFSLSTPLAVADEYSVATSIHGTITAIADGKEGTSFLPIGEIHALLVHIEHRNSEESAFDIIDMDTDTYSCCHHLIVPYGDDFSDELHACIEGLDIEIAPNILYLQKMHLLPDYRGRRIGLAVIHKTISTFARKCGVVVMKPYPGQFWKKPELAATDPFMVNTAYIDKSQAIQKLAAYYSRLGFSPLAQTGLMVLDPYAPLPEMEQLGFPLDGWLSPRMVHAGE